MGGECAETAHSRSLPHVSRCLLMREALRNAKQTPQKAVAARGRVRRTSAGTSWGVQHVEGVPPPSPPYAQCALMIDAGGRAVRGETRGERDGTRWKSRGDEEHRRALNAPASSRITYPPRPRHPVPATRSPGFVGRFCEGKTASSFAREGT